MIVELGVEHTPSPWVWLANKLGIKIHWTHAFLRHDYGGEYRIIEARWNGVVEHPWRPESYHSYAIYRLREDCFADGEVRQWAYFVMFAFARGSLGKRYRYEALPIILRRLLRPALNSFWRGPKRDDAEGFILGTGEVCTSLVDKDFLWGGFDLVPGEPSPFVLPDELVRSEDLEMVEMQRDRYSLCLL